MTKPMDPEIKALRAMERALRPLDEAAKRRALEWLSAATLRLPWVRLPPSAEAKESEE